MNQQQKNGIEREGYCWNTIGTWSDNLSSCPKLQEVTHCKNCDHFISSGRALLEATPDATYLEEWKSLLAKEEVKTSKSSESVVIFRVGNEWFALQATKLREIVESSAHVHKIPHRSDNVLMGIVNINGELELCFSLKAFLGIDTTLTSSYSSNEHTLFQNRFIVLEAEGFSWVFKVDEILGIHRYDKEDSQNLPVNVLKADSSYTKHLFSFKDKTVGYLDDELIVYTLKRKII